MSVTSRSVRSSLLGGTVWRANNFAFDHSVTFDNVGGMKSGYPGQSYDAETGFWHNYMRDYDGLTGRYLESDPIGLWGGLNTYLYSEGDPVGLTDAFGLCPACLIARPPILPRIGRIGQIGRNPWYEQLQRRISPKGGKPKNDVPSWARGKVPKNGEKPNEFAQRVCEEAGQEPGKGPGSNLNQIRKYAETHFEPNGSAPESAFFDPFGGSAPMEQEIY
jgi:RHS repeat-associated protein